MAETIQTEAGAVTGTTKFGAQGLNNPTPKWVTWVFRVQFIANKAALIFFVPELTIMQIKILACIDFIVWGLGRFVGVKKEEFEQV